MLRSHSAFGLAILSSGILWPAATLAACLRPSLDLFTLRRSL
jgi:hypothetical protein